MVDSSTSDAERRYWMQVLKLSFVALVGLSAGLIAVQGGGSPTEIAAVVVAGGGFGAVLLRYLTWMDVSWRDTGRQR